MNLQHEVVIYQGKHEQILYHFPYHYKNEKYFKLNVKNIHVLSKITEIVEI